MAKQTIQIKSKQLSTDKIKYSASLSSLHSVCGLSLLTHHQIVNTKNGKNNFENEFVK